MKPKPSSAGVNRRDFILGTLATGAVVGSGLGAFYYGYGKSLGSPLRVGVIGTGDEGKRAARRDESRFRRGPSQSPTSAPITYLASLPRRLFQPRGVWPPGRA